MSQTFKLYRLQQIDSQLDKDHSRLQEIEAALSNNDIVRQAQLQVDQAARTLHTRRSELRQAEANVQSQRNKIEMTNSTLYGGKVRNPKELKDLEAELAALKRYLSVLEDRQLEQMLAVEEAEGEDAAAQSGLLKAQALFTEQSAQMRGEQTALNKAVAQLESEREGAASALAPGDLALYEQLRKTRRGIAVSKVVNKACSACGTTLSTAGLQIARSPNQVTRCEICGRILYAD